VLECAAAAAAAAGSVVVLSAATTYLLTALVHASPDPYSTSAHSYLADTVHPEGR
jgi:hypothetical protein